MSQYLGELNQCFQNLFQPFVALGHLPFVTFEVFVRPALRKMQGHTQLQRPTLPVRLGYDARATADRTEYQRVNLRRDGRDLVAVSTGSQSSSRLMSLAGAHALVRIPPGDQGIRAGAMVEAMLLAIVVGAVKSSRKVQERGQDVLGHRADIAVAARSGDDHVAPPQISR